LCRHRTRHRLKFRPAIGGGLSPQDKLRILVETDQTAGAGGIGATLRREGL
jgi:hypothetical protein